MNVLATMGKTGANSSLIVRRESHHFAAHNSAAVWFYDACMTLNASKILAWTALAAIIFVTISPIGLRPQDLLPVNVDRALAFGVMAGLFVIAYPRQWIWVGVLILGSAGAIELLQEMSPTRHANIEDAVIKAAGAAIGLLAGWSFNQLRDRLAA